MALLDEDPGYGQRTMGGRPPAPRGPGTAYAPPPQLSLTPTPTPTPQPVVVDRVAWLTKQRQILQETQRRMQQEEEARRTRPRYPEGLDTRPLNLLPPSDIEREQLPSASDTRSLGAGFPKSGAGEIEAAYKIARTDIPGADFVADAVSSDPRFAIPRAIQSAVLPDEVMKFIPKVGDVVIPQEVWELAVELTPIGFVGDFRRALKEGAPEAVAAMRRAVGSPAGQTWIQRLSEQRGSLPLIPGGGDEAGKIPGAGDAAGGVPAPAVDNLPPSTGPYIEPPPIPTLSERFPLVEPNARAGTALDEAKAQSSGGMLREPANALAEHIDDAITRIQDGPTSIATSILRWFSSEATRFRGPLNEGITEYKRVLAAGDTWASETGGQMGRKAENVFKGKPNDVYRAADGQPVFVKAEDGPQIKLLNRDALENVHVPEVAARMTPEQRQVATETGDMLRRLRTEARESGARLGGARAVDGSEVSSYVHRTAIDKDGVRFMEYGDPVKPGAKLHAESARDYVTAAEGAADGVRYANSWQEEYVSHLRSLRKHKANAALKQWTDSVSETLAERIARLDPAASGAREAAGTALKSARRKLTQRQAVITQRLRREAEQSVRKARKSVSRAQRQLDRATTAPELDKVEIRQPNAMKVGEARERLVSAIKEGDQRAIRTAQRRLDGLTTQAALQAEVLPRATLIDNVGKAREDLALAVRDLRDSAQLSIDALYRRMDDADRVALLEARADVEAGKGAVKAAGKQYMAASERVTKGLGRELFQSPGGQELPITAKRYFNREDARVLFEFAKDNVDRNAPTHPIIAAWRLLTAPMNFTVLTADNSFIGVQGMLTMVTNPVKWAKMVVQAPIMAASPRFRARWLKAHEEGVRWVMENAPHTFDANPDFAARGSLTAEIAGKIHPVAYLNQLFQDGRTMSAVYLAEIFAKDAKNPQEAFELASAIGKMVGVSRTVGAERDVMLAAGFFRSKIGLAADALTNGGIQGGMARQALGRLVGGAALATLSYKMFVEGEKDPQKLLDAITPGKDDAFEIEGINLLGTFSSELNTIARLVMEPGEAGDTAKFFGRSKLNIPLGSAISSATGTDILGKPTSFMGEFGGKGYLPLSWQQYQEWELRGAPKEIAIPAAIFGIKYSPPSAYENLADAMKAKGIEPDTFFGEAGTRAQAMADFPDLKPLYSKWEQSRRIGTVDQRRSQKIVDASRAKIEGKIAEVVSRRAAPTDLKEFTQAESDQRRITRDALFPERDGKDTRLDPLYGFYDEATNPATGELDFDKLLQMQESYLSQNEELRPIWEQQQYVPYTDNPVEAKLKDGQRTVNSKYSTSSGFERSYYGASDLVWGKVKEAWPAAEQYATADDFAAHIRQQAEDSGVDPNDRLGNNGIWDDYSERLSAVRVGLLSQHPEVGAALRVWYGVNLPDTKLSDATANEIRRLSEELIKEILTR